MAASCCYRWRNAVWGVAERLARSIPDRRDKTRIAHSFADMIRARIFAICCGYEDADDLDFLRVDPAFKLACGRLPDTGRDLASQPTLSRLEKACAKPLRRGGGTTLLYLPLTAPTSIRLKKRSRN